MGGRGGRKSLQSVCLDVYSTWRLIYIDWKMDYCYNQSSSGPLLCRLSEAQRRDERGEGRKEGSRGRERHM